MAGIDLALQLGYNPVKVKTVSYVLVLRRKKSSQITYFRNYQPDILNRGICNNSSARV
jgi:hypothetical protein